jgi:hypothetical protein
MAGSSANAKDKLARLDVSEDTSAAPSSAAGFRMPLASLRLMSEKFELLRPRPEAALSEVWAFWSSSLWLRVGRRRIVESSMVKARRREWPAGGTLKPDAEEAVCRGPEV